MNSRSPRYLGNLLCFFFASTTAFAAPPAPRPTLLDLAKKKFAAEGLTPAERQLFTNVEKGEFVSGIVDNRDDPKAAGDWPPQRVIRADRLKWLCTDREASGLVSYRGLILHGIRIDGVLNLEDSLIPFPIAAWKCAFQENIRLTRTRMRSFYLVDCRVRGIEADDARVDGNVFLQYGFTSSDEVRFAGATIDGTFSCSGAHLANPAGLALDARGIKVSGGVLLQDDFTAEGEVNFLYASIGGNLACDGAQLRNPGKMALTASASRIGGYAFFWNGFQAEGEISLLGATISGGLVFDCASASNPQGKAVDANGITIGGSVFFRESFTGLGEINFASATVHGSFECDSATLQNPGNFALNAYAMNVGKSMFLRDGFTALGAVSILNATIEGDLECGHGSFLNPKPQASGSDDESAKSPWKDGDVAAINAEQVNIKGSVLLQRGFVVEGWINFVSATVGGDLLFADAQLTYPNGYAFNAENINVAGNVYVRAGTLIDGSLNLFGAKIGMDFMWTGPQVTSQTSLDLRNARAAILEDAARSWPNAGRLFLDGFTYDRIVDGSPVEARIRTEWLDRQPKDKFRPQPYEQLASVLRTMGHEVEARDIMIQKNFARGNFTTLFWREWWWYNFFGWLIGYGYLPSRAFFMSVGLIVLGTILFRRGYHHDLIMPTKESAYARYGGTPDPPGTRRARFCRDYPRFNAFVFSLEAFTPLLRLDQSSNWTPNSHAGERFWLGKWNRLTTGQWLRIYLWCHIIAGWILTSLWVGSITGLVKT